VDAPYLFADAFAYLVAGRGSLDDLNARLALRGGAPVTLERFRPNVVIADLPAYEEDHVRSFALPVNAATLRVVKPCARCTVPGVDPDTGEATTEVPDLLAGYRGREAGGTRGEAGGVMFGVNAVAEHAQPPGRDAWGGPEWPLVRQGDPVDVTLAFD
jgi:hypothetical protein